MEVLGEQVSGKHSRVLFAQIAQILKTANLDISSLDAVLYAAGPGSYTGLRVGGSALKGLLFPHADIAFHTASTLAAYACCVLHEEIQQSQKKSEMQDNGPTSNHIVQHRIKPAQGRYPQRDLNPDQEQELIRTAPLRVHAMIDARRQHAYHQVLSVSRNGISALSTAQIQPLTTIESMLEEGDYLVGTGLHRLDVQKTTHVHKLAEESIDAAGLLRLFTIDNKREFIQPADIRSFEPDYMSGATWNHAR